MTWTKTQPKAPGNYWIRKTDGRPAIVRVYRVRNFGFRVTGGGPSILLRDWPLRNLDDSYRWSDRPIPEPDGAVGGVRPMSFRVDGDDERAIRDAVEAWKFNELELPEGDSDDLGAVVGEICRGWMDMYGYGDPAKQMEEAT